MARPTRVTAVLTKNKYPRVKYLPPEAHLRGSVHPNGPADPGWKEIDRDDYMEFVTLRDEFFARICHGAGDFSYGKLKRFTDLVRRICPGIDE